MGGGGGEAEGGEWQGVNYRVGSESVVSLVGNSIIWGWEGEGGGREAKQKVVSGRW